MICTIFELTFDALNARRHVWQVMSVHDRADLERRSTPEDATACSIYIDTTGMAEYRQHPGSRGAWMLRRDDGDRSEIITFSLWDSRDSIRAFAGEDIEQAVFYPEDDRFLIERDGLVRHWGLA